MRASFAIPLLFTPFKYKGGDLAAYPPDIVIEIARNACHTLEFDRASEMIELGYRRAKECLSQTELQNWNDEG